jgi:AcrR family transcriptional regulator
VADTDQVRAKSGEAGGALGPAGKRRRASAAGAKPRQRNAEATKGRILQAARQEFARHGLAGARVDAIADRAKANKRMIYHYFAGKDDLFRAVLEEAFIDIRGAEKMLHLDERDPVEAIRVLVEFTWNYYLEHPEFLTLVNSENLHKARHLKKSKIIQEMHRSYVAMISGILRAGVEKGEFRSGIDPVQLNITIAAVNYFYFNNRFTGSIIYDRDYMDPEALKTRLAFNIDTILRLIAV